MASALTKQTLKPSNDMMITSEDSCTERKLMENEEEYVPQVEISTRRSFHIHPNKKPLEPNDEGKHNLSTSSPEAIPNYPSLCEKRFSKTKIEAQRKFSQRSTRSITPSIDNKRMFYQHPVSSYRDQVKIIIPLFQMFHTYSAEEKDFLLI